MCFRYISTLLAVLQAGSPVAVADTAVSVVAGIAVSVAAAVSAVTGSGGGG